VKNVFADFKPEVVICCLASRSGTKADSEKIDYQASLNTLKASQSVGAKHFILLSAFCVRKPLLEFQKAKLKFESSLINSGIRYSIVRPTAFFKSVSGQLELLQNSLPFVMFGEGSTTCNPISELDLAEYMLDCIEDSTKWGKILNIGGPDAGMTMKEQGSMLFQVLEKKPRFLTVPIALFDGIIGVLSFVGKWFAQFEDAAELARIGSRLCFSSVHAVFRSVLCS